MYNYSDEFEKWWVDANTIRGNPAIIEAAKRLAWAAWDAAQPSWKPLTDGQVGSKLLVKAEEGGKAFVGVVCKLLNYYTVLDLETRRWVTVSHYNSQLENLWQK